MVVIVGNMSVSTDISNPLLMGTMQRMLSSHALKTRQRMRHRRSLGGIDNSDVAKTMIIETLNRSMGRGRTKRRSSRA